MGGMGERSDRAFRPVGLRRMLQGQTAAEELEVVLEVMREVHDDQRYLGVPAHLAIWPCDFVWLGVDNCSTMLGVDNGLFARFEEVIARFPLSQARDSRRAFVFLVPDPKNEPRPQKTWWLCKNKRNRPKPPVILTFAMVPARRLACTLSRS